MPTLLMLTKYHVAIEIAATSPAITAISAYSSHKAPPNYAANCSPLQGRYLPFQLKKMGLLSPPRGKKCDIYGILGKIGDLRTFYLTSQPNPG
jgi:hypothetical protein